MHRRVFSIVKPAHQKLLGVLLDRWPEAMTKDELAEAAGYSPTSGGFFNLCGRLRTLGLIDYPRPGEARAEDILFPENRI